ncbi:T9SS type A sorting domain-containing protein [Formosa sp. S-31]|uniref:T9SS type A sorting domain-containing protein n=1 Tax=Formosa sp. S-31 TaxID=2790949 RepID=UPI003EBF177B
MRRFLLNVLIILLFFSFQRILAQTDLITNISSPVGILLYQEQLYFAENLEGKILKIDINSDSATPIEVASGLSKPARLTLKDNYLYVSEFGGGKISKLNIGVEKPTVKTITSQLDRPDGLLIYNNYLYFTDYGTGILYKKNIENNSLPIIVIEGLKGPRDIKLYKNELYISESSKGVISKINLDNASQSYKVVISNIESCSGFLIRNDHLFVTQRYLNKILKININNLNTETILSNIKECVALEINQEETELYIASYADNKIIKYYDAKLSIEDKPFEKKLLLYPNPVQSQIQFKNLSNLTAYKLFNIQGQQISKGELLPKQTLNVNFLNPGLYFLKTESETFRFIKQ